MEGVQISSFLKVNGIIRFKQNIYQAYWVFVEGKITLNKEGNGNGEETKFLLTFCHFIPKVVTFVC